MALTRKYLHESLGLEDETVDKIISAHTEVTSALKDERDALKAEAEKVPTLQKELETLKANAVEDGKNPWKVKYEAVKEEYDNFKSEIQEKETTANKLKALKSILKDIGVSDKRIESVAKVTDISMLKLDKEGNIEEADKLKASLKEEWSDFIVTEKTKGADVAKPPMTTEGAKMSKEDIMKITDTTERQKAIAENHQLFGY